LTIKSISNTKFPAHHRPFGLCTPVFDVILLTRCFPSGGRNTTIGKLQILVVSIARQIFDCQRSDFFGTAGPKTPKIRVPAYTNAENFTFGFFVSFNLGLLTATPLLHSRGSETLFGGPG